MKKSLESPSIVHWKLGRLVVAWCAVLDLAAAVARGQQPNSTGSTSVAQSAFNDPVIKAEQEEFVKKLHSDVEQGKGGPVSQVVPKPTPPPRAKRTTRRLPDVQKHEYDGYLGEAAVNATVSIASPSGNVEGDMFFLRAPTRLYTLKGQNSHDGQLRLTLLNDTIPIAAATLTRARAASVVKWAGKLHDADGKSYDFFLTRSLNTRDVRTGPKSIAEFDSLHGYESYQGTVRDRRGMVADAFFKLKFLAGRCFGYYYQRYASGETSAVLRLDGENKPEELTLRESDNDQGFSARLELTKVPLELSPNKVVWKGLLKNIRDNQDVKDIEFSRKR